MPVHRHPQGWSTSGEQRWVNLPERRDSALFIVTCQIIGSDHCNLDGHSIDSKKMQHLALHAFGAMLALMIPVTTVSA